MGGLTAGIVAIVVVALLVGACDPGTTGRELGQPASRAGANEYWVSPDGNDGSAGSRSAPWATLSHAFQELAPGDTLNVVGGEYRERIRGIELTSGTPRAPITVRAVAGEDVVVRGLLWLEDADYWSLQGIGVTWDAGNNDAEEHMVKFTDGVGWSFTGAEVWGASSFAAILVATSGGSAPAGWRIAGNCIHSTVPSNDTNQDHLVYVNSGLRSGPGVVEGNLMFDAPNGSGVKLGGPDPDSGGAARVTVRHNTIAETAQAVLIAWDAHDNVVESNVLASAGDGYALVRGFELDGEGNVARDNVGWDAAGVVANDAGHGGVIDEGNQLLEDVRGTGFSDTGSCDGYTPTDDLDGVGHLVYGGAGGQAGG